MHVFREAHKDAEGKFPFTVLHLNVPHSLYDVNVTPDKTQVIAPHEYLCTMAFLLVLGGFCSDAKHTPQDTHLDAGISLACQCGVCLDYVPDWS